MCALGPKRPAALSGAIHPRTKLRTPHGDLQRSTRPLAVFCPGTGACELIDPRIVAIHSGTSSYPTQPPYHPAETYPEQIAPNTDSESGNFSDRKSVV